MTYPCPSTTTTGRGKQTAEPGGIWYTPFAGIWQTGGLWCIPESWLQGHALWHVLCAVAARLDHHLHIMLAEIGGDQRSYLRIILNKNDFIHVYCT